MSLATHGKLVARAGRFRLRFDGNTWTGADAPEGLCLMLTGASAEIARNHVSLQERAEHGLRAICGEDWVIEKVVPSRSWDKPLPPGAID